MNRFPDFAKSSVLYFLGNILSKLITFFLLPIYTSYISPEDLGYYDVSTTYLNLIVTFLFIDIYVAIMRFVFDEKHGSESNKPIFNGIIIFLCSLFLYTIVSALVAIFFDVQFLGYIYVYGVSVVFSNLLGYLARALDFNRLYAFSGVVSTLVSSVINILLIVYLNWNVESLFFALTIGLLVQTLMLESKVKLVKRVSLNYYDKVLLHKMFVYSYPLALNSLAYWLLTGYANVMIARYLGLEANGIYMIAMKFGLMINMVSTCFSMAWQELIFRKGNEDKKELSIFYSNAMNMLILFLTIGLLILIPMSSILFPYVIADAYKASYEIIPLYIVAATISVVSSFWGQIYAALKATHIIMYSTIIACIVNVLLVPFFIHMWGLIGAIIAVIISYLVNVVMRICLIRNMVKISLNCRYLLLLLCGLVFSFYVYYQRGFLYNIFFLLFVILGASYLFRTKINEMLFSIYTKNGTKL